MSGDGDSPNAAALFEAANKLRGTVESAEYKHLVLGLLFLKYISDSFELRRGELEAELSRSEPATATSRIRSERAEILEDRDEYVAENVFWVPRGRALGGAARGRVAARHRASGSTTRSTRSSRRTPGCGTCCRASTPARRCRRS